MRQITKGIIMDEAREGTLGRWYFSASRVSRALQSQGLSPDGAASIVGQMVEEGMRALRDEHDERRCPQCGGRITGARCINPNCLVREA